ncbi:MAG: hypothetical protein Q7T87_18040 [Polaromonas sp.]|nr:hypothetical protein [Polaromonas sp.]
MYLIVIAWMYVVLMMSIAEATNTTGTILGAIMTFVLYGLGPVALVIYLLGAPARGKANKQREAEAFRQEQIAAARLAQGDGAAAADGPQAHPDAQVSTAPDTGGHPACGAGPVAASGNSAGVAPVREEK